MNRYEILTDTVRHDKAVQVARGLKTECMKKGKGVGTPEMSVADYILAAVKAYPAYRTAEAAVKDIGETGLPAAVIRRLKEGV